MAAAAENQLDNSITVLVPLRGMTAVVNTTKIELDTCAANLKGNPDDVAVDSYSLLECLNKKDYDGDGVIQGRK